MASQLKQTKGFEALYAASKADINTQSDALVCFLHAYMTSHGFSCVGSHDRDVRSTDLLPNCWNSSQDAYVLRYLHQTEAEAYTFKAVVIDGIMAVQLLRKSDEAVTTSNIKINTYTADNVSDFASAYRDLRDLEVQLETDLLHPFQEGPGTKPFRQQPRFTDERNDPLRDDRDPLRIGHGSMDPRGRGLEPDDPFAVGRGDLDPLNAGVGGGMFMDPMRRGPVRDPNAGLPPGCRLPPGAVPPGARFDPFGPPGIGPGGPPGGPSRFGPTPDHMRPPGYDDMFM